MALSPQQDTPGTTHICLVDYLRFSRDCLIRAFRSLDPHLRLTYRDNVMECMLSPPPALDILLYHSHENTPSAAVTQQQVSALKQRFPDTPIVILSDVVAAPKMSDILSALNCGAQGFIPTVSTEVPAALAAIRFVKDGGTFAPINPLLAQPEGQATAAQGMPLAFRLTARQLTVLSLLRQGKANRIIASELQMAESTVKVHIRNIMRKMRATNRTHAVYLADLRASLRDGADHTE